MAKAIKLRPFENNPRTITAKEAERLKIDLRELGDLGGIVHDLKSGRVCGGHQRLRVMFGEQAGEFDLKDASIEIVKQYKKPTATGTVAEGFIVWNGERYAYRQVQFSEKKFQRANIVANLRGGSWDMDMLSSAFKGSDLIEWGFDNALLKSMKNEMTGIIALLESEKPAVMDAEPQLNRAEELQEKWKTKTGQLWKLADHRLSIGDSTKREDVEKLMGKEKAEITFTSPPYWVGKDYEYQKSLQEVKDFIKAICENMALVTNTDGGRIIINTSTASARAINKKADAETFFTLAWYQDVFRDFNWLMRHCRVWVKNGGMGAPRVAANSDVIDQHWEVIPEFLPTFYYPDGLRRGQEKIGMKWAQLGVWSDIRGDMSSEGHIAAFPLELPRRYILLYTKEGEIIYEPFAGSGTTIIASHNLKRKCYAMEISENYAAVILERMSTAFPGIEIKLIESKPVRKSKKQSKSK